MSLFVYICDASQLLLLYHHVCHKKVGLFSQECVLKIKNI